jgi:hypothetical protein
MPIVDVINAESVHSVLVFSKYFWYYSIYLTLWEATETFCLSVALLHLCYFVCLNRNTNPNSFPELFCKYMMW